MIYELRVFHCVPGRLPALLKRFENDTLLLFAKHGVRQVGFWTVAIGESSNDLFLILEWESLADREQKFGAFYRILNGSKSGGRASWTALSKRA